MPEHTGSTPATAIGTEAGRIRDLANDVPKKTAKINRTAGKIAVAAGAILEEVKALEAPAGASPDDVAGAEALAYRADDVLARLAGHLGMDDDAEIARAIGFAPEEVAEWRRKGFIPHQDCFFIASSKGVALGWLTLGAGEDAAASAEATGAPSECKRDLDIGTETLLQECRWRVAAKLAASGEMSEAGMILECVPEQAPGATPALRIARAGGVFLSEVIMDVSEKDKPLLCELMAAIAAYLAKESDAA